MSGELVIVPAAPLVVATGGAILLGGAAAVAVAAGVQLILNRRLEAARAEAARLAAEHAAMLSFQHRQQQAIESARREYETARAHADRLASVGLAGPSRPSESQNAAVRRRSTRLPLSDRSAVAAALEKLGEVITSLPESLQSLPAVTAVARQRDQALAALGRPTAPRLEEVEAMQTTLARALRLRQQELDGEREWLLALGARVGALLDRVTFLEGLHPSRQQAEALKRVGEGLCKLLGVSRPRLDAIETMENTLDGIEAAINEDLARQAAIASIVDSHLGGGGYEWLEPLGEQAEHGVWYGRVAVPGGGQARIGLHGDGRLDFAFEEERNRLTQAASKVGLAPTSPQEARFCRDATDLLRGLAGAGFDYAVAFRRNINEDALGVARVEDAAQILEEERRRRDLELVTREMPS